MSKFNKIILSENIKYHISNGYNLDDIFRLSSDSYDELVCEARSLFKEGLIQLSENDQFIVEKLKTGVKAVTREGDSVTLDKPQRISNGKSKFRVWRDSGKKTEDGKIIAKKIDWGDPKLSVKNGDPKAAKSFRARHKCSEKTDKDTAGWWACNVHLFAKQLGLDSSEPW